MGIFSRLKKMSEKVSDSLVHGAGRYVNQPPFSDLENSALWACVVNLSRLYATLPWGVWSKGEQETDSALAELLRKPNPYMTDYDFRFCMGFNYEMHGEAVAVIERGHGGLPVALYPVSPRSLVSSWDTDGALKYTLVLDGQTYKSGDVLLLRNTPIGYEAGAVLDPIAFAHDDIELEEQCQRLLREYYTGATVVGNIVSYPSTFTNEQVDNVRQQFRATNKYRTYVLDERIKLSPIQIVNADVQKLTEAQKWGTMEIARRFSVPPFFIGDMSGSYGNAEQQGLQMVTYCLQPRVASWEAGLARALCRKGQAVRFDLSSLLRGDHATRMSFYQTGLMYGILSVNEVRAREGLKPIGAEGDEHFFPTNLATLEDVASGAYARGTGSNLSWGGDEPEAEPEEEEESCACGCDHGHSMEGGASMDERRKAEGQAFAEALERLTEGGRKEIERLERAQIDEEVGVVQKGVEAGRPPLTIEGELEEFRKENSKVCDERYMRFFKEKMRQIYPVVRKQTGKSEEIDGEKLDGKSLDYAKNLTKRIGTKVTALAKKAHTEEYEKLLEELWEYPADKSGEEIVRMRNAFTYFVSRELHVERMRWVSSPDGCELCASMDGKTVEITGEWFKKGQEAGGRVFKRNYKHPPIHSNCLCSVMPD